MDGHSIDGFGGKLQLVSASDVQQVYALESESYPEDEAASLESLEYRQKEANSLFLGYYEDSMPCAYACSTRYHGPRFIGDSMHKHLPNAECVCIHSVVVRPDKRHQGLGTKLMVAYIDHIRASQTNVEKILLISKQPLVPFYTRCGFTCIGAADVTHGKDTWYEMELHL